MTDEPTIRSTTPETVRILLVEDNPSDALLFQRMLAHSPGLAFSLDCVASLSAAVCRVTHGGIDIVILDLSLPDSCGFDTLLQLRTADAKVPIVVLTGLDDEALAVRAVQAGAQDYLAKEHVDRLSLVRVIRYAIERQRAQVATAEAHDLLRSLFDCIPDEVYVKDMTSRFITANPVTAHSLGLASPEELIGKCDHDFFPPELADGFLAEEQALLYRGQPCVNREAMVTDPDGNIRWVLTTKAPLRDHNGKLTGLLGINRDITGRKLAEERIRQLNEGLEKRVAARTADLETAMARLEEHDRARAEFVSNVSHEMKTPLTSMKLEIGNLLDGVAGPVPDRVVEYLEMLNEDCQRLSKTVEDVLDLSRLENHTMRLNRRKLPFERLVQSAAIALKAEAHVKNIKVICSSDHERCFVDCDAFKMERMVINIIGNAIKFTPEGGAIEITLRHAPATQGAALLEITDSGIGIAPQYVNRVTEKYFRVGEHVSGTGLGLPIAKEIVEFHGGRLALQSPAPGRTNGTMVSICMPTVAPPTILVAAHEDPIRQLIEQQMVSHGYRVLTFSSGAEALKCVQQTTPEVMIVELYMPGMDGEEVILRMKSEEALRGIPLLMVTGAAVVDVAIYRILEEFGIPLIRSPWSEEELLDQIDGALIGRSVMETRSAERKRSNHL